MTYLEASYFFDFKSKAMQELITSCTTPTQTAKEKAIAMYTHVRDQWRYDPYHISLSKEKYKASYIASKQSGNCVEKSILLIACLRGMGLPARLHLGKVKNHLAVERLTEKFGSNELTPHGMVNVFLNGTWLKMSPAFNASLCEKLKVAPLAFDGEQHSFLQQYNSQGNLFMEYTADYGYFDDVPLDFMIQNLKTHYPQIFDTHHAVKEFKL